MAASPLVVILGPTAVGKSVVAEHLARRLDGEVIGVDSMQVYRGLEIGTAKPDHCVRERIPYHLVDVCPPSVDFNLGDFVRAAEAAITDILSRARLPILAGGTGMYLRGLLKGIDPGPRRDPRLRQGLMALAGRRGPAHLHRLLLVLDPRTARSIGSADEMRLVRSLERVFLTGRPSTSGRWGGADRYPTIKVGLSLDEAALRRRIDRRVEVMFAEGLVEETARLLSEKISPGSSALKALGYRQVVAHLRGGTSLAETIESVKRDTWRFSRRQMTWFRREKGVHWIPVDEAESDTVCREVEKYVTLYLAAR